MTKSKFLALEKMLKSKNINDVQLAYELLDNITDLSENQYIHFRYLFVLGQCESIESLINARKLFNKTHSKTTHLIIPGKILLDFSLEKFPLDD